MVKKKELRNRSESSGERDKRGVYSTSHVCLNIAECVNSIDCIVVPNFKVF